MNWETIDNLLPLLKFGTIFAVLVFAISRKWTLAFVLGGGAIAVGLLFGMGIIELGVSTYRAFIDFKTIRLFCLVWMIITFSVALKETGHLQKFIDSLERLIPSYRISMAIVPATVGLLPMPGGAIFSAPMVDELAEKAQLKPAQRTYTNHWFRHIWEYILPLYPGIFMASAMWDIPARKLVLFQSPLTVFSIIAGFLVSIASIRIAKVNREDINGSKFKEFIQGFWPFATVVAGVLFLPIDILIVVTAMLPLLFIVDRVNLKRIWKIVKGGFRWKILLMIIAIMVFKRIMEDSGAAHDIAQSLISFDLPIAAIFFTLPFIVGLLSGITIGFVGICYPILIPMLGEVSGDPSGVMMLAYLGGFLGTMLSPLHLCLILTNEYFKSSLIRTYYYLIPTTAIVAVLGIIYYFVLIAIEKTTPG